jgi:hypothetical protein
VVGRRHDLAGRAAAGYGSRILNLGQVAQPFAGGVARKGGVGQRQARRATATLARGCGARCRGLHAVFQYFDEACKLLQIIAQAIERDFTLPQIARYTGMTFDRGAVMFRKQRVRQHDVFAHVVIYYTLTGPPPPAMRV